MSTDRDDDLEAVLRTLKLAQAQLRALKTAFTEDNAKQSETDDAEVAIDLIVKKLTALIP